MTPDEFIREYEAASRTRGLDHTLSLIDESTVYWFSNIADAVVFFFDRLKVTAAWQNSLGLEALGIPPGHGGIPPAHGGVPPGQAKKWAAGGGLPPGQIKKLQQGSGKPGGGGGKGKGKGK